jgi:hypothetical protein
LFDEARNVTPRARRKWLIALFDRKKRVKERRVSLDDVVVLDFVAVSVVLFCIIRFFLLILCIIRSYLRFAYLHIYIKTRKNKSKKYRKRKSY